MTAAAITAEPIERLDPDVPRTARVWEASTLPREVLADQARALGVGSQY